MKETDLTFQFVKDNHDTIGSVWNGFVHVRWRVDVIIISTSDIFRFYIIGKTLGHHGGFFFICSQIFILSYFISKMLFPT